MPDRHISKWSGDLAEAMDDYYPASVVSQLRYSILKRVRAKQDIFPDIQGRADVKMDVARAVLSGTHPYLVSEEGTGKTRLARSLTRLLPPALIIKGCPYHDDPKWPAHKLCHRCRSSSDPVKEFGLDIIPGEMRFSRIQGNEYTNEAKLLGLKDIQAIAQGRSPTDPSVFTGTGVFRANRGVLLVDELPAIRTNVQVLLHPLLEEKRIILEEYHWYHPLDLLLIATGNPTGFSHVYEVPRPLLDRLELIYMDLPDEAVEKEIMLRERWAGDDGAAADMEIDPQMVLGQQIREGAERAVVAPWWIVELVNKTVRYSRVCSKLERKASIRASGKALDHTYSSIELENRRIATMKDAYYGMRLALRGRIGLDPEFLDFSEPQKAFKRTDRLVEDLMWNALEDFGVELFEDGNREKVAEEIKSVLSNGTREIGVILAEHKLLAELVDKMKRASAAKMSPELLNDAERALVHQPDRLDASMANEYSYSAMEMVINIALHKQIVSLPPAMYAASPVYIPQRLLDFKSW